MKNNEKDSIFYIESEYTIRSNVLHHHFSLPEVDIQVQNGHGASTD